MSRSKKEHEYDLDAILGEKAPGREAGGRNKTFIIAALLVVALLVAAPRACQRGPMPESLPNLAERMGVGAQLSELIDAGGDWIGTVRSDWDAVLTPSQAMRACEDMSDKLDLGDGEILTLMTAEGLTLASCER